MRPVAVPQRDRVQPNALDPGERAQIVAWLSQEDYAQLSVQQVFWRVFDAGHFVASQRTWYRVAAAERLVGDRRRQSTHPPRTIPVLCAGGPNQVWSWDITRIRLSVQKTSLHLYLIEDVFSRKCVGWRLEHRERDEMAADLIENSVVDEQAKPHTLHADGGPSMTSTRVHQLLSGLGIDASHSRPHVSNDNPFSEALFKTLKYDLAYPGTFATYDEAKAWIQAFVERYNHGHHHSGLAGFTPANVHDGTWTEQAGRRQALLDHHHRQHTDRYRRPPRVQTPPGTVWINQPQPADMSHAA